MRADLISPEAFAALVRERQQAVFRTLTRLTGTGPHIEDLAQEAFLRLYRALPEFRGEAALSTYLYRIVVNVAQDEWKRRRREREHIAELQPRESENENAGATPLENCPAESFAGEHTRTPEQHLRALEFQAAVDAALLTLPERERAVLVLYHQEELSYEGVAASLGLPVNTVRTHLHRGRNRLRAMLAETNLPGRQSPAPDRSAEEYAGKTVAG